MQAHGLPLPLASPSSPPPQENQKKKKKKKKRDATRAWIKEAEWVSPEARSARGAVPLSHQRGKTEGGEVSLE